MVIRRLIHWADDLFEAIAFELAVEYYQIYLL